MPDGKCNEVAILQRVRVPSCARMDGPACTCLCQSPLRLEPEKGTSSLGLGQPGQATTTIRILRDLVHNANANGLTWGQFD